MLLAFIFSNLQKVVLAFICVLLLNLNLMAQAPQLEKANPNDISDSNKEQAQKMANDILSAMADGAYYQFSEDSATPQMVQAFTEATQKQAYSQISAQVGGYQSELKYQEAYHVKQGEMEGIIYRFKGTFANSVPEVRVVMTKENKIAGLLVVPWNDQLR
ncbi:DUF3887 domain-containing protein [Porifericola rhodea]|uniref:DUF3887 domain-containing protein n=1 Tax=Porifericola rhodea TaxID=930972 RepID=UPI0026670ECC|nr:DUF3887 domain-containing protein [Porifericola rhodea]WKN30567.1 DUF3887 domain-containing protein [Porifericola rhodea]